MRFTPSSNWTSIAAGSNRVVTWTVSVKKTTSISASLSTGTWLDVTSYVVDVPNITQGIEYELGQFTSDSVSFSARNIDWWEANVFNASASEYLELKITATLSRGSTTTSDTFIAFSGFIDKAGVIYDELNDSVQFDVFTADELGNRRSILNVNTQYVNNDVDGSGTPGSILPRIPGLYVMDADVASYQLKVGLHSIEYEYNGGTKQARLDGGAWLTLRGTDGIDTLTSEDGNEKIDVYVDVSELYTSSDTRTDYIIVETAGDTLPRNPVYEYNVKRYIKSAFSEIGITSVTFDSLVFNTYNGNKRLSFYDLPPNDVSIYGKRYALVSDGTDMYVAVGNRVFKRSTSTEEYTLVFTITGSDTTVFVKKMFYNSRNNDLYVVYTKTGVGDCARRYDIGAVTLSSEVVLDAVADSLNIYAMLLIDYNYTGSSYKYGLLYNDVATTAVKFLDDSSLTVSTVITMGNPSAADASFLFEKSTGVWWVMIKSAPTTYNFNEVVVNGSGTWVDNSSTFAAMPKFVAGCYNTTEDTLYFFASNGLGSYDVRSYTLDGSAVLTDIVTSISFSTYPCIFCASNDSVYFTVSAVSGIYTKGTLYEVSASTIDDSLSGVEPSAYSSMTYTDRLYGIQLYTGRLFQWHTSINMFLNDTEPSGTIKGVLSKIFNAYNLVSTVSANKTAFVYRRGNDSGTIQTTGNSLALTTSNTSQIQKVLNHYQKVLWVQVTSGTTTYSYDGTTYNAGILADSKTLTVSNDLIPSNVVQDVCKYFFAFYNANHDRYTFNVDTADMQYEVMDGCSVTFSTTKIGQTATGLITSQTINNDGSMKLEVIF